MKNSSSLATSAQSSRGIGSIGISAGSVTPSFVDKRDPAKLGEELLAMKKRYGYKKLSTAYDRRIRGTR